ncbi:hypothetical protein AA19596_1913 [Acetobacter fabarum DSM 19596]|nr:hypothetical protein AA19596_1913 [Acetobacter fabarum DSM 19596]
MLTTSDYQSDAAARLADIVADDKILWGIVANARPKRRGPRWVGVMERTGMGSTASVLLCRRFGFDPDEVVK